VTGAVGEISVAASAGEGVTRARGITIDAAAAKRGWRKRSALPDCSEDQISTTWGPGADGR